MRYFEGGNALEIGFELCTSSIRDILWQNCDVIHVEDGAVFSIHNADWATVENVRFEDIWGEGAEDELIDLAIGLAIYSQDCPWEYFRLNPDRKTAPKSLRAHLTGNNAGRWLRLPDEEMQKRAANRGRIRNVHFRNIHVAGDKLPYSTIIGYDDDHLVENVTVENLAFRGKVIQSPDEGKFRIDHARGGVGFGVGLFSLLRRASSRGVGGPNRTGCLPRAQQPARGQAVEAGLERRVRRYRT